MRELVLKLHLIEARLLEFFADFDGDDKVEVAVANKGGENPDINNAPLNNVSIFKLPDDPDREVNGKKYP